MKADEEGVIGGLLKHVLLCLDPVDVLEEKYRDYELPRLQLRVLIHFKDTGRLIGWLEYNINKCIQLNYVFPNTHLK